MIHTLRFSIQHDLSERNLKDTTGFCTIPSSYLQAWFSVTAFSFKNCSTFVLPRAQYLDSFAKDIF